MPKTHVATLHNCHSQMLTQAFMICIGQTLYFFIFLLLSFLYCYFILHKQTLHN
jgi:hypothetical protein